MKYLLPLFMFFTLASLATLDGDKIPLQFSMPRHTILPQYSQLSCKIDTLYYALGYYVENLPDIRWFVDKIPVQSTNYLKEIKQAKYAIANPYEFAIGELDGQLARFASSGDLLVLTQSGYKLAPFNRNNFLDTALLKSLYNKKIGLGIDSKLLVNTFSKYFSSHNIKIEYFSLVEPTPSQMASIFIEQLNRNRVIFCNAIVGGYNIHRVINLLTIEESLNYMWKEASHSFIVIGYDLSTRIFIVADNYGELVNPYTPKFRSISFKTLYDQLTMIDKKQLDYSFSIGVEK